MVQLFDARQSKSDSYVRFRGCITWARLSRGVNNKRICEIPRHKIHSKEGRYNIIFCYSLTHVYINTERDLVASCRGGQTFKRQCA